MEQWELIEQNPWWENPEKINEDSKIKEFSHSRLQWFPRIFNEFDFSSFKIYTIRGMRQVGKTTLLKLLIRKLLHENYPSKSIFYYSLDFTHSYKEITEIYRKFKLYAEGNGIKKTFVFLDEITSVLNWQRAIKHLVDIGLAQNSVFILTGSSAIDIKKGSERMPGRRGGGMELDKVLLPLSFREYMENKISLPENFKILLNLEDFLALSEQSLTTYLMHYPQIQNLFEEYVQVGGLPMAVNELWQKGSISKETYDIFLSVIISDIEKWRLKRTILIQVMKRVYEIFGSRWSWQGLAKGIDVGSFHTVTQYVETLADSYILSILYFFDPSRRKILPKKEKKIYFLDPLIFRLFASSYGISPASYGEPIVFSKLIEGVVFSHLLRISGENLSEGLSYLENLHYWYSKRGSEIDFVIQREKSLLPVEVKYQEKISPSDYITLSRVFGKGLVLTKKECFKREEIIGIPVSLFLALSR